MKFFLKVKEHMAFVFFVIAVIALVFYPMYYKELNSEISLRYIEVYTALFLAINTILYFFIYKKNKKCASLVLLGEFALVFIMVTFFVAVSQKVAGGNWLNAFDGYQGSSQQPLHKRNIYAYGLSKIVYQKGTQVNDVEVLSENEINMIIQTTKNVNVLMLHAWNEALYLDFKKEVTYNNKEIVVEFK